MIDHAGRCYHFVSPFSAHDLDSVDPSFILNHETDHIYTVLMYLMLLFLPVTVHELLRCCKKHFQGEKFLKDDSSFIIYIIHLPSKPVMIRIAMVT